MGYCLLLGETLVFGFMLIPLYSAVSDSDSKNVFTTLASFPWLFLSKGYI
jgi:hypothetical protein